MKKNKSRTFDLRRKFGWIGKYIDTATEDRVTVYAAQASFFIVIAAIPFIMLLISIAGLLVPKGTADVLVSAADRIPGRLHDLYEEVISDLYSRPAVKLISVTAVTAFWMSSRGVAAVMSGISTVYKSRPSGGPVKRFLFSFVYTIAFLIIMVLMITIQLFGEFIYTALTDAFPKTKGIADSIFRFRAPVLFVFLTLFFALLYFAVNRRGTCVCKKFRDHLPGAILASAGWLLFSFFYSLYTIYFTGVTDIYGSLTTVVLFLLWLYVCMIILLVGAEINKALSQRKPPDGKNV